MCVLYSNKERTLNYVDQGVEEGATLVLDGREDNKDEGYFVKPTIFEDVTTDMKLWQDEIFALKYLIDEALSVNKQAPLANSDLLASAIPSLRSVTFTNDNTGANISSCHNFISVVTSSKIVGLTK